MASGFHVRGIECGHPALVAAIAGTAVLLSGCASTSTSDAGPSGPVQTDGGSLRLDSSGATHQLAFEAPSAGWSLTFDRLEEDGATRRIFVTTRRPDPSRVHAQQIVDLRLDTTIPSTAPLRVHLRTLDHGQAAGSYREVIR